MIILKILFFVFVLERLIFKNIIRINMMFDQVIVKTVCFNNESVCDKLNKLFFSKKKIVEDDNPEYYLRLSKMFK